MTVDLFGAETDDPTPARRIPKQHTPAKVGSVEWDRLLYVENTHPVTRVPLAASGTCGDCIHFGRSVGSDSGACDLARPMTLTRPTMPACTLRRQHGTEARTTDPETSRAAAASLTHKIGPAHRVILAYLGEHGPDTDDGIAEAMVEQGLVDRHEQARRLVRTLREGHGMIVPETDLFGHQRTKANASGREALVWRLAGTDEMGDSTP